MLITFSEVAIEVKQEDKRIEELREEFILLHAKHHKLESEKNEVSFGFLLK